MGRLRPDDAAPRPHAPPRDGLHPVAHLPRPVLHRALDVRLSPFSLDRASSRALTLTSHLSQQGLPPHWRPHPESLPVGALRLWSVDPPLCVQLSLVVPFSLLESTFSTPRPHVLTLPSFRTPLQIRFGTSRSRRAARRGRSGASTTATTSATLGASRSSSSSTCVSVSLSCSPRFAQLLTLRLARSRSSGACPRCARPARADRALDGKLTSSRLSRPLAGQQRPSRLEPDVLGASRSRRRRRRRRRSCALCVVADSPCLPLPPSLAVRRPRLPRQGVLVVRLPVRNRGPRLLALRLRASSSSPSRAPSSRSDPDLPPPLLSHARSTRASTPTSRRTSTATTAAATARSASSRAAVPRRRRAVRAWPAARRARAPAPTSAARRPACTSRR